MSDPEISKAVTLKFDNPLFIAVHVAPSSVLINNPPVVPAIISVFEYASVVIYYLHIRGKSYSGFEKLILKK